MLKAAEVHIGGAYRGKSIITDHQLGMQKAFLIKVNPDPCTHDIVQIGQENMPFITWLQLGLVWTPWEFQI